MATRWKKRIVIEIPAQHLEQEPRKPQDAKRNAELEPVGSQALHTGNFRLTSNKLPSISSFAPEVFVREWGV